MYIFIEGWIIWKSLAKKSHIPIHISCMVATLQWLLSAVPMFFQTSFADINNVSLLLVLLWPTSLHRHKQLNTLHFKLKFSRKLIFVLFWPPSYRLLFFLLIIFIFRCRLNSSRGTEVLCLSEWQSMNHFRFDWLE